MVQDKQVVLRVSSELVERADALKDVLSERDELRAFGRVSRSSVMRLAVQRGLEVLEAEYGAARPRRHKRKKK